MPFARAGLGDVAAGDALDAERCVVPCPDRAFGKPLVLSHAGGFGRSRSAMRDIISERLCETHDFRLRAGRVIVSVRSRNLCATARTQLSKDEDDQRHRQLTVQDGKEEEFKAAGAEMVAAVKSNEAGRTLAYTLTQSQKAPTEF